MLELQDLYNEARKYGIKRADIGKFLYGKNMTMIYLVKNPTLKTLKKIENAIKELKKSKKINR